MISHRTHRINKVVVSLNCASRHRASVSEIVFPELIGEALDTIEITKTDKIFRIDKAFISINLESQNLPAFKITFREILAEKLEILAKDPQKCEIIEENEDQKNGLFSFLQDGNLPWYIRTLNFDEAPLEDPQLIHELKKILKEKPELSRRLLFRADEKLRIELLHRLTGGNFSIKIREVTKVIVDFIRRSGAAYDAAFRSELIFAVHMLQEAVSSDEVPDFDRILNRVWPDFVSEIAHFIPGLLKDLAQEVSRSTGLRLRSSSGTSSKDEKILTFQNRGSESSFTAEKREFRSGADLKVGFANLDSFQVENSGLIILHPFLKTLFQKTGLLEHNEFQDNSRRERAVCLLHYLATGTQKFPDEKLSMPKFICGYPLENTVPLDLPISPYEIKECDNMLRHAIAHWKALKNTGIEGFRFNFLRRRGVLKKDMHGYILYVEKETADVLLARLPWPLSPVRFPWRPDLITVKWD